MRNFGETAAILFSKCCTMSQIFSLACQFNKAGIAYFCQYVAAYVWNVSEYAAVKPDGAAWADCGRHGRDIAPPYLMARAEPAHTAGSECLFLTIMAGLPLFSKR